MHELALLPLLGARVVGDLLLLGDQVVEAVVQKLKVACLRDDVTINASTINASTINASSCPKATEAAVV